MPAELEQPILRVTMRDGSVFTVETESPDLVYFDLERQKRKWPTIQEGPFIWLHYIAYSALRRDGGVNGSSFDTWLTGVKSCVNINESGEETTEPASVFPTPPGPVPD